ncbi:Bro-N domain-containing protein [Pseudomonas sp. LP_7_YM]|uniref:BRO-N domain-containing protein n=1 Tax=Pseudomonas sp. LP_7_YM TaxID=2485137 RepID=UPI00105B73D7|nr:Bro-N domain-containing protein [Pseudomonas sp. LP_7_YM]TDV65860.1 prophage antirepressor-like protein [Pseudomonas sp. LP_7_YM]
MEEHYEPLVFTRHNLKLHALVLERQAWFCARDLGRFLGMFFEERITKKLGADQRRHIPLRYYGEIETTLMVSESAVYALLVYHGNATHHPTRKWLTYQVLPMLHDQRVPALNNAPAPNLLKWGSASLSVMHWQDEAWIRLRDMPHLLQTRSGEGWWEKVKRGWSGR